MKKKNTLLIFIIIVLIVVCAAAYFIINDIFPRAKSIRYPMLEDITSVYTSCNTPNATIRFSEDDYEKLISNLKMAKSTRRQSINDTPAVFAYYMIEIKTAETDYRYFVYEEEEKVYLEVPYEGIYVSNMELLDCVLKYYQEG